MFVFYSIKFYGGKAGKQAPNCRVLLCFKPLRRNVPLGFYSLCLVVFLFLLGSYPRQWQRNLSEDRTTAERIAI